MKRHGILVAIVFAAMLARATFATAQVEKSADPGPSSKSAAIKKAASARKSKTAKNTKTEAKQAATKEKTKLEIATFGGG